MGKLIVIEGIDASGKTSVVSLINKELTYRGYKSKAIVKKTLLEDKESFVQTDELNFYEIINKLIWGNVIENPDAIPVETWAYVYATWYSFVNQKTIYPCLKKLDYLIIDGWWYKILSRIMITSSDHKNQSLKLGEILPSSDMNFLLLTSPDVAWERRNGIFNDCERGLLNNKDEYIEYLNNPKQQFLLYQTKVQSNLTKLMSTNSHIEHICTDYLDLDQVSDLIIKNILHTENA